MDNIDKTLIGKDVIESLTTSMYEDPRFIFREYIQNSADAIDKAKRDKLIDEGHIFININQEKKMIEIEDDAIGIETSKVISILKNIAQSTKIKGSDKGFRGIGRLGGLGYCNKLIFETSVRGENIKSIMTWDAAELKKIIADRSKKEEAHEVIDAVTSYLTEKEDVDKHYFKVILQEVTNNDLLDVATIREYLSMVAPVPFKRATLTPKIYSYISENNFIVDEYQIFVNTEQIFKGYKWYVYEGDQSNRKQVDEVIDIVFFKEEDKDNIPLYWGWYAITNKIQSLQKINFSRGFRLRNHNIQIGNDDTLQKFHKDRRFQFYFFGEVHAVHPELHPNARRDYFSENSIYCQFENKLKIFFQSEIHKLCYDASKLNSALKDIDKFNQVVEEYSLKNKTGYINNEQKEELEKKLQKQAEIKEKAIQKILNLKDNSEELPIHKIIEKSSSKFDSVEQYESIIEEEIDNKPIFRTEKLSKLNKKERKFISDIFEVINNVLTKDLAENLIHKIEEKYK
ncbi:MAG: ATP-binding protein [Bacteroidales bacterium]